MSCAVGCQNRIAKKKMTFIFIEYRQQRRPLKLNADADGYKPLNGQTGLMKSVILVSAVLISYQARFSPLLITHKGKINDAELVTAATTTLAAEVACKQTKLLIDSSAVTSLSNYASI